MNTRLATAVLAAACLLALPWSARAQNAPASMPVTQVTPAHQGKPMPPLAWSSLDAAQQRMLAPVQGQWDQLKPAHQHRLAEHATQWAGLPPARQKIIGDRLSRWAQMTPEQRRQLRENARAFHKLSPDEREKVRAAFEHFRSLPPDQRKILRERWRQMPPAQRMQWANQHSNPPIPMHPPARGGH